jgi:glycosyltransferase involved in cell wall biosynthesis
VPDNLPNTVLEAMACGVAAVGPAAGGIPDMIRHDVTGRTIEKHDAEALAVEIINLLNDRKRTCEMGANARRIALEEYSLHTQAQRYAALYGSLS